MRIYTSTVPIPGWLRALLSKYPDFVARYLNSRNK